MIVTLHPKQATNYAKSFRNPLVSTSAITTQALLSERVRPRALTYPTYNCEVQKYVIEVSARGRTRSDRRA